MAKTFKILSALLSYPSAELQAAVPELRATLDREMLLSGKQRRALDRLLGEIETRDLYDLQERYVLLFDRTRSLSLHLFEHIHGESRERGQALVDLGLLYERHGLAIETKELPDYLPLFLEFLSTIPADEAHVLLSEPLHIIVALRERLKKRQSTYASVLWALETIATGKPNGAEVDALLSEDDDDPENLEALDEAWAEEPVTFGPGPGGCPKVAGMLERLAVPKSTQTRNRAT